MQRRWLALGVVVLVAGCGGVDGAAVPQAAPDPWDPCSIPTEAIAATGLGTEVVEAGWGEGISMPDWERCLWQGPATDPWYYFGVLRSASISIEELRADPQVADAADINIEDRRAVRFHTTIAKPSERCELALSTTGGLLRLYVSVAGGSVPRQNPCDVVVRHAEDLLPNFPSKP
ncbi:Protein of unknown function [Rhodococcoides kyotonense]|uniref:DUF3558 domain-containing protein n=2 Tax=Rhodococcoides kyotonense TaxID=398843 RepID=A0A239ELA6_9NOCA|nr:Protein of unknown function [Rhodococcus kyotonensis]